MDTDSRQLWVSGQRVAGGRTSVALRRVQIATGGRTVADLAVGSREAWEAADVWEATTTKRACEVTEGSQAAAWREA
jgi:hypothetical protein